MELGSYSAEHHLNGGFWPSDIQGFVKAYLHAGEGIRQSINLQ
jgi:hypothetical protein